MLRPSILISRLEPANKLLGMGTAERSGDLNAKEGNEIA
jgi:hypothetical protein